MSYAIYHDWSKYDENLRNHGRSVLVASCKHKDGAHENDYCDKGRCSISEDSAMPMMNYLYPLELSDFDDKEILAVVKHTNCTVIENEDTGEWFLTLCGGGMNLSQDIALAYHFLETWIPYELAINVSTQAGLSIGGKQWEVLRKAMKESLDLYAARARERASRWEKKKKVLA
jgi:hypothetical protein